MRFGNNQSLIPFLLACLAASSAPAQQAAPTRRDPTPSFRSDVEVVTVDVVVADTQGRPVMGLKPTDFQLREDGQPQTVTSFEAVDLAANAPTAPPSPVSSNARPDARVARTFVLLFDDMRMDQADSVRAREAVAEFLGKHLADSDRVLLAATSGRVWWSARTAAGHGELLDRLARLDGQLPAEGILEGHITDYEAMRISRHFDTTVCDRVQRRLNAENMIPGLSENELQQRLNRCEPLIQARAQEVYNRVFDRGRVMASVLERVMDAMSLTRGRKAVLLVSPGFISDPTTAPLKAAVTAARRANVAVYFLSLRGLQAAGPSFSAGVGTHTDIHDTHAVYSDADEARGTEGAELLADETGGFSVRHTNDLAGGLGRIADESRAYYLLGYVPSNTARDGRFRKISVEANRKDVVVRARRGYYAVEGGRAAGQGDDVSPEIRMATDAPFDVAGIPLRIASYVREERRPGQAHVQFVADVDLRPLAFEQIDGRFSNTLELLLTVAPRDGGGPQGFSDRIHMSLKPETRASTPWYPYTKDLDLPAGRYLAKLVVRDRNAGQVGSVMHDFEVGSLGGWRVATPVLTDVAPLDPASGRPQPVALARRELSGAAILAVATEVFGAAREGGSGAPRVTQGYAVLRDGREVKRVAPTLIRPDASGRLSRVFGFGLDQLAPGDYEMVLEFVDEIAQRREERREPFAVVSAITVPAK